MNDSFSEINISVSVIIPSYNSIATIGHTIDGVRRQTAIGSVAEILVVDSSDDENTHAFLKEKEDSMLRVIRSGYRVIPAIQRNIGAREARGDLLCFIDSDAFPANDWIEHILMARSRGYRVGGGSYEVPEWQRKNTTAYAQYFIEFSLYIGFGREREEKIVASCNLFCDKKLFLEVGGFPEIRASEDSLFCLKVGKVEIPRYLPQAVVNHIFRENREHFLSNQRMLGKFIYLFRRQSYDSFYYRGILPYLFFPAFITFKFARIFIRALLTGDGHKIWYFLLSMPLMGKGLAAWSRGFTDGIKEYRAIHQPGR